MYVYWYDCVSQTWKLSTSSFCGGQSCKKEYGKNNPIIFVVAFQQIFGIPVSVSKWTHSTTCQVLGPRRRAKQSTTEKIMATTNLWHIPSTRIKENTYNETRDTNDGRKNLFGNEKCGSGFRYYQAHFLSTGCMLITLPNSVQVFLDI